MKKLIPTISKMAMGGEPPRKPIYVSNKNNPRLKSYQDSLSLYNKYPSSKTDEYLGHSSINYQIKDANNRINLHPDANKRELYRKTYKNIDFVNNNKIKPIAFSLGDKWNSSGNSKIREQTFTYQKPVQPVIYKPKVTPTVNKKIQMETTKLDTVPIVQPTIATPPTPLTKKQYYEVPDVNGKTVLLTPEQFSRMSSGNKNDLMSKSPIMNKPKYFYEMNSSGKRQLIPESKIREYMQSKNK
jgi:hypothetical protein